MSRKPNKKAKAQKPKKQRKKHEKTEYEEGRDQHRKRTNRHYVEIEIHPEPAEQAFLLSYASSNAYIGRRIRAAMRIGLEQLDRNKKYQRLRKEYGETKEHLKTLTPDGDMAIAETEHLESIKTQLTYWQNYYDVTHANCVEIASHYSKQCGVHSYIARSTCEDVWQGVEEVLFGDGKRLNSPHSDYEYPIIKGRAIERGIVLKVDKKTNELYIVMTDSHERAKNRGRARRVIRFAQPADDLWLTAEYQRIVAFMLDPHAEEKHVNWFMETGEVTDTWRPCYVQIKIKKIRNKWRYYLQICVEAAPLPKFNADGSPRHDWSKTGRVGLAGWISAHQRMRCQPSADDSSSSGTSGNETITRRSRAKRRSVVSSVRWTGRGAR